MSNSLSALRNLEHLAKFLCRKRAAVFANAPRVPLPLLQNAFTTSRQKNFGLAKWFSWILLGPDWDYALLGYSYVKCVDYVVDDDVDSERALAFLHRQRELLEESYAGPIDRELPSPDNYGQAIFVQDANNGSPLRSCFEDVLDTMEVDVRRRNQILSADELDAHFVKTGTPGTRYLCRFASPCMRLPSTYLALSSCAYLWADSLIDVKYDLEHGIVNIPAEDIARFGLTPAPSDAGLRPWMEERSAIVMQQFREALSETDRLTDSSIIFYFRRYLIDKRKRLCRFLKHEGIAIQG